MKKTENKKVMCFGYARKSPDDKNKTESSIINQVKLIESWCQENLYNLQDVYIDQKISGGDRNRKELNRCIKSSIIYKNNNPDVSVYIVVKDQNRFARDSAFFQDTLKDLNAYQVKVFSIIKNDFISNEDLGDVVTSVVDAHQLIEGRKKAGVLSSQKQDLNLPSIPAPFGYRYNKGKIKDWVIDKRKSIIVLAICNDYINCIPLKESLSKLKINKSLYYRVVKNAIKGLYIGYVCYDNKIRDSNKKIVRSKEIKYKGTHPSIINQDVFEKVLYKFS